MARFTVAMARAAKRSIADRPLAVVAQDDNEVVIVRIPEDVMDFAVDLGLPSLTFVGWVEASRDRVEPRRFLDPSTGRVVEIPVTDRRWLERFVAPSLMDTVRFTNISEREGRAAEVARELARMLAGGRGPEDRDEDV